MIDVFDVVWASGVHDPERKAMLWRPGKRNRAYPLGNNTSGHSKPLHAGEQGSGLPSAYAHRSMMYQWLYQGEMLLIANYRN